MAGTAPVHPYTTIIFVAACWMVAIDTIYKYPSTTLDGVVILLLGVPVCAVWQHLKKKRVPIE
jgi:APA family basic amino acid/polyamine antiporter